MKTKVKDIQVDKENDLETNHFLSIPENIQKQINNRGFYLYEWIGSNDIKNSIQRDFLKVIGSTLGQIFSILFILISGIILYANESLFYTFFFGGIGFIVFLFVLYILILTFLRVNILRKNAYVLVTDTSSSINGEIKKLENGKIKIDNNLSKISKSFEENLFGKSRLKETKSGLFKNILENLGTGFKFIFKLGEGRSKNSGQLILLLLLLYSIYIASIGLVYVIGILVIWFLGIVISIINKQILLITGHQVTTINKHFEDIDSYAKSLIIEKENLIKNLIEAKNNDWKDSLLSKINSGLENINKSADKSVNSSLGLKDEIISSKYKEMFNFSIYNSWIKKQIYEPLFEIKELLEKNIETIRNQYINIEKQINDTKDVALQAPLTATKKRLEKRLNDIMVHKNNIELYLNKLL